MIEANVSIHDYEDDECFHVFLNSISLGYLHPDDQNLRKKQLTKLITEAYNSGYKKGVHHIQSDLKSLLGIQSD
jgi:hypothetical protein